ncbi:LRR receptor-like serine/threonine-protein kinase [Pyrus ussuriensis x Pyrus communis]|uniref:LRR receptor-like serine/threonine-protein kinase n=1 Tax=Pyrus ussuriensis x Pyrus communis TaxID=2448454 RepID=A0A5N5H8E7_9ROSA|nr:LRR receptor-like serine/threonine-protein kinase [Pyrus ussuriensis x Pyrus communis]
MLNFRWNTRVVDKIVIGQIEALKMLKIEETARAVNATRDVLVADVKANNMPGCTPSNTDPRTTIST